MATASFVTDLTEIVTQAVEAAAMVGSLWSSFEVVEQARAYYNLYNSQRQFYFSVFQTGAEAPLATSVYNTPIPVLNYAAQRNELYLPTGVFGGAMGDTLGWWTRRGAMFGEAQGNPTIYAEEYAPDRILTLGHWTNIMYRYEESLFDTLSDQRWDHRMKLHNVALKEQSKVISGLASAENQREDTITQTGSYLAEMSNSLAQRRGNIQGHKDVQQRYAELGNSAGGTYAGMSRSAPAPRAPAQTYGLGSQGASQALPGHFETVN